MKKFTMPNMKKPTCQLQMEVFMRYYYNKALDIDEVKAFHEWSQNNLELCTKSTLRARARDEAQLAKRERAHQKAIEKLKAKHEKENRDLRISAELLKKAIALQGNQD